MTDDAVTVEVEVDELLAEIELPVTSAEIDHPCDLDLGKPSLTTPKDEKDKSAPKPADWRTQFGTKHQSRNAAGKVVELVRAHPMHHAAMALKKWVPGQVVTGSDYKAALDAAAGVKSH